MYFARANRGKDKPKIKKSKIKLMCKLSVSAGTIELHKEDLWKIEYL